jgi:NAD(P)-dependent dehydrogenase (short-subunit alcohol dehydrogenase family)
MRVLNGKVALVTGGASGLGKAIAERFVADGARVVITDIAAEAGEAAAEVNGIDFLRQDVSDQLRWREVVTEVERQHGRLDVLVNNAGTTGSLSDADPEATRMDDFRRVFAINVEGVLLGCQAAIPAMRRKGGGSIINLSSVAGLLASPYATAYGASKAAVRQLTQSIAQHCAEHRLNIRCNSIHPGIVRTPLWEKSAQEKAARLDRTFEAVLREAEAGVPLGALTAADDIAAMAAFLASEQSRNITGERFIVDGGMVSCSTFRGTRS